MYRCADKSLARPTSRCILFDGQNISFDASLVIYINSTHIPPITMINRAYEHWNLLLLQFVSFLVGLRTYQHPCTKFFTPVLMLIREWGKPVWVWNAGNSFFATCSALSRNITSPVRAKHVSRPPIKRMFVSNTERSVVCEQRSKLFFTVYWKFLSSWTYIYKN